VSRLPRIQGTSFLNSRFCEAEGGGVQEATKQFVPVPCEHKQTVEPLT